VGYVVGVIDPVALPDPAWHRAEVRDAARARDIPALLRYAQHYTGASQGRLATAFGMAQGRVNEILNRRRAVASLDVFERIADGLAMPDDIRMLLGLAPRGPHAAFPLAALSEVTEIHPSQAAAARSIRTTASQARQVDVLAVRGLGILGLNDGLLRGPLSAQRDEPLTLRVLVLDPAGPAAARRARELGETPESFAAASALSEARLRELAEHGGVRVEAYRYRTAPIWRIIRADDTMFVGTFDALREGHSSPVYRLPARVDGTLYRAFTRVVEDTIADAERVI
jgi:transcriptional regulator with XRE-family HTH domain